MLAPSVELQATDAQLWALAQLVKRLGWSDVLPLAVDKDEAQVMLDALDRLADALKAAGYAPR